MAANTAFQVLENVAVLAEKGVLRKGWDGAAGRIRRKKLGLWSSRAWMLHVGLEIGRLVRLWGMSEGKEESGKEDEGDGKGAALKSQIGDEVVIEAKKEKNTGEEKWWRDVLVNAAYAPITMHWSVEDGILAEPFLAALGLVAAGSGFRQAWRETM